MNGNKENCNETNGANATIEQLKQLIFPENLEVSKLCSLLSDEMSCKIDELYSSKELQNLKFESKEKFIEALNLLEKQGTVKITDSEVHINLSEQFTVFSLINVPNKMTKQQLLEVIDIKEEEINRIYKQSLYWTIVCDNAEINKKIEKKLSELNFEENPLKFEATNGKTLKNQILKKIQHFNYSKETDELKAISPNPRKGSFTRGEKQISTGLTSSEPFSWRKKSDVSNTSSKDDNLKVSSFNNNKFPRRERFNSDPHDKTNMKLSQYESNNKEIVIDPTSVQYSLVLNYKYSTKDMQDYFEKNKEKISNNSHQFKSFIEEVCNEKSKNLSSALISAIRKSSFEVKSSVIEGNWKTGEKVVIPSTNPLQKLSENK